MPAHETTVVVIGEPLVDIISDPGQPEAVQVHPGGSPLNVAVGAARLGLHTSLVTHYADDRHGLMIEEHLRQNGVHVINGGTAPTSTALATLGPDGAADYTFAITWELNGASLPALAAIRDSTHVHAGSIATVLPPGDQATRALPIRISRHRRQASAGKPDAGGAAGCGRLCQPCGSGHLFPARRKSTPEGRTRSADHANEGPGSRWQSSVSFGDSERA